MKQIKIVANNREMFLPFLKHPDGYAVYVSNCGRVIDGRNGAEKKLHNNGNGYLFFTQGHENGSNKSIREYIHRAVAGLFISNPDNLPQVNHKNLDKSDNSVENLEWISRSSNILHAHATGAMVKRTTNAQINILTEQQVVELYTEVKKNGVGISIQAKKMGIPRTTASSIINKRSRWDITDNLDELFKEN